MRSERGTAEQTAPARDREWSGVEERGARMTNYSSLHSASDRLPRWIRISPEPCRMGRSGGKTDHHVAHYYIWLQAFFCCCWSDLICSRPDVAHAFNEAGAKVLCRALVVQYIMRPDGQLWSNESRVIRVTGICHNNPALLSSHEGKYTLGMEVDVIGPVDTRS